MRYRIRIFAVAVALAVSLMMVAPAQARPGGDNGERPAASWWNVVVDALATLFGLDRPMSSLAEPKQGDGSCWIDPAGNPVCPAPQPTLQSDGSVCIDPDGKPICAPRS